jgi:hypothetical protein
VNAVFRADRRDLHPLGAEEERLRRHDHKILVAGNGEVDVDIRSGQQGFLTAFDDKFRDDCARAGGDGTRRRQEVGLERLLRCVGQGERGLDRWRSTFPKLCGTAAKTRSFDTSATLNSGLAAPCTAASPPALVT